MQFRSFSRFGICLSAALMCAQINAQESYRSEVGIIHLSIKHDGIETNGNGIAGTYHFSPVDTRGAPLAESNFLTRTSSASIALSESETSGNYKSTYNESESSGYSLSFEFKQKGNPNTVSAGFNKHEADISHPITANYDFKIVSFALGRYFTDTLHVELNFVDMNTNDHTPGTDNNNIYSVNAKYVKQFGDGSAYNLETNIVRITEKENSNNEKNTALEVWTDYYFSNHFSLGGGVRLNRGDDKFEEGETLGLNATYFISPAIGLELQTERFYAKQSSQVDDETLAFSVALRF